MTDLGFLKDLVIVFGAAVLVVAVLRRLGVPSIAGFILTGVITGPAALGLVGETHQVEVLAEIGVVLLLFGIGLELSLERLARIWKAVVIGGGVQVFLTIVVATAIALQFGMATGSAIFLGFIVAVSSTAVVLRGLSRRGEIDAPHGRLAMGILVFQDLCVVPMIMALPFLAGSGGSIGEVFVTVGTAVLILAGVLILSGPIVPRLLELVAKTRERDLFILTVFLVCFGIAWAVSLAGVSLALGAFLAGLVVAGSEFRHQAMSDLIPAREVLASLFFVSVGMLLDLGVVAEQLMPTLGLLAAILLGKFVIILATAAILRLPLRVGILSAAALCQVGEFSFVLLGAAPEGLLDETVSGNLLVAIILSMMLTPMAIAAGPHIASNATRFGWLNRLLGVDSLGGDAVLRAQHVLVAGYGMAGREVCRAVRDAGFPYIAVDANPDNVRMANAAGDRALLGDITQKEIMEELACKYAVLVVLCINDPRATELATRNLRAYVPDLPIIVRTPYEMDKQSLEKAGATEVITAESTVTAALVRSSVSNLPVMSVPKNAG